MLEQIPRMRWATVMLSCLLMVCWSSGSGAAERRLTGADLRPISDFLNHQIATGRLPDVSSGPNRLLLSLPEYRDPLEIVLTIPTIELSLPGIHARMQLKKLRFRHIGLKFDEPHESLRLRIYFHNQRNGVVGYYTVGPVRKSLKLHVRSVKLDIYFKPRVDGNQLVFDPIDTELSFYEGNIPAIARPLLLREIDAAVDESRADLQQQFDAYAPQLSSAIAQYVYPNSVLEAVRIKNGSIAFLTHSPSTTGVSGISR